MASKSTLGNAAFDSRLAAQTRDLKLDLAHAAEQPMASVVKAERERLWRLENADAIRAANEYAEKNGPPLAQFRQF